MVCRRRDRVVVRLTCAVLLLCTAGNAQSYSAESWYNQAHEPSYITFAHALDQADERLLFEARIAAPLKAYLSKAMADSTAKELRAWTERKGSPAKVLTPLIGAFEWMGSRPFEIGLSIVPRVVLRMDNCTGCSKRVRTPSYMPRAILYLMPTGKNVNPTKTGFFSLMLSHHSNGQQGGFYRDEPPLTSEPFYVHIDEQRINHAAGNFSTNYLEVAWHRPLTFGKNLDGLGRYSIEHHPEWLVTEDGLLEQRYSRTRLHMSTYGDIDRWAFGRVTLDARFSYLMNRPDAVEGRTVDDLPGNWIIDVTYYVRSRLLSNFGLFLNYYQGEDYYNIRFNKRLRTARIGIISDPRQLLSSVGL